MSEQTSKKYITLGKHLKGKFGDYLQLGDANPRNPKYKYTVQMRVLDSDNNVVATLENPSINLRDPRSRKGISEEQAAKIPDFVLHELSATVKN